MARVTRTPRITLGKGVEIQLGGATYKLAEDAIVFGPEYQNSWNMYPPEIGPNCVRKHKRCEDGKMNLRLEAA